MPNARRVAINVVFIAILILAGSPIGARAQSTAEVDALHAQVGQLYSQGKHADAIATARKALAVSERTLGKDHPHTITSLKMLALLYNNREQPAEAEQYYKRTLETEDRVLGRDHPNTLKTLGLVAGFYQRQGRYAEAEPFLKRLLDSRERALGKNHADTLSSVNDLAVLYVLQGRLVEAEPLLLRAYEGRERALGRENADTLTTLNNLAVLFLHRGRYKDAERYFRLALETEERVLGMEHEDTLATAGNLAEVYRAQGRYAEAEAQAKRVLTARERVLGNDHAHTITAANNLAEVYRMTGRYAEAEQLLKRALENKERIAGKDHPETIVILDNLGALYRAQGRYNDAERLQKRAAEALERVLGRGHPDTLTAIENLAELYRMESRFEEAEALEKRVLAGRERLLGPQHGETIKAVNNLALIYHYQGRRSDAEPLYRRALEAHERASEGNRAGLFFSLNNLAALFGEQERFEEAEQFYKRALQIGEQVLGNDHPDVLACANNLGNIYSKLARVSESDRLLRRALTGLEKRLGPEHPATLTSVNSLALLQYRQQHWAEAAQLWRRSTGGIIRRMQRDAQNTGQALTGRRKSEAERLSWQFGNLLKAVNRTSAVGHVSDAGTARETFQLAQWALGSEAAQALAQMAARGAAGHPELAVLVRERQDLTAEWHALDELQNVALGRQADERDANAEAVNAARLAAIDARIAAIDRRLRDEFPDYAALASASPLDIKEVQAQLHGDEALVLFLDTQHVPPVPEETFVWVVTKTAARWVRSDLGTVALGREVQRLRCGLDADAWTASRCASLAGQNFAAQDAASGKPLPFDYASAHSLYKALFGQVDDLINGRQLLLVPSGALTQLPFQVLVTAPSADGDPKTAAWLVREHALTVLPAVSSLKALRRIARPSAAAKPLIGFGNPLLDGPDRRYARQAQLARDSQRCRETIAQRIAALFGARGVMPLERNGGLARVSGIRAQVPLPETADELCAVARDLRADPGEIRLGARATEHEVKALSTSGQLAQYRIVHFATHGALAGELKGTSEPGLLLTPPDTASEDDDGYLSASEIAKLKLDADWVILSACNTAAGDTTGAQALSGLARAFIYAQARALLVSHWPVDSAATVKLITAAMRETAGDDKVGRAEALRRAMLALIGKGEVKEAHPAYWAPFVVVGEGAR